MHALSKEKSWRVPCSDLKAGCTLWGLKVVWKWVGVDCWVVLSEWWHGVLQLLSVSTTYPHISRAWGPVTCERIVGVGLLWHLLLCKSYTSTNELWPSCHSTPITSHTHGWRFTTLCAVLHQWSFLLDGGWNSVASRNVLCLWCQCHSQWVCLLVQWLTTVVSWICTQSALHPLSFSCHTCTFPFIEHGECFGVQCGWNNPLFLSAHLFLMLSHWMPPETSRTVFWTQKGRGKKNKDKRIALAGTRTRIDRVAGDHSTLRPPVLHIFSF